MTAFVDLRFRGLRVAQKAKLLEGEGGVFVEFEQPLPVGAPLSVVEEGKPERPARVVHVVEHEAGAGAAGMRLVWDASALLREEAVTLKVEKAPTFEEPAAAPAAPVLPAEPAEPAEASSADASGDSSDASTDGSEDGGADRSTDGTVDAPVQNGNSSKKSKKHKKRR